MTNDDRLRMIQSAMETLSHDRTLSSKLKQRGLRSLQQAYKTAKEKSGKATDQPAAHT